MEFSGGRTRFTNPDFFHSREVGKVAKATMRDKATDITTVMMVWISNVNRSESEQFLFRRRQEANNGASRAFAILGIEIHVARRKEKT